jgi:hypothetical protein
MVVFAPPPPNVMSHVTTMHYSLIQFLSPFFPPSEKNRVHDDITDIFVIAMVN